MKKISKFLSILLILFLTVGPVLKPAHAIDFPTGLTVSKDLGTPKTAGGNEFVSGDYPGAVLMKVNLWGAVGKPGIHYVPTQTDLVSLLSYAGGPMESAKLSDVYIKRWTGGKEQLLEVDTEELLKKPGVEPPVLQANDIVVIPQKKPLISNDTSALIGVISSVLSIVAVSIVLVNK